MQVVEVVDRPVGLVVLVLQLGVERDQLLVGRLQLLLGGLQLLVGALQLLVGGLDLLVGRAELLVRGFVLLDDALQGGLGLVQLVVEPVQFGFRLGGRRRPPGLLFPFLPGQPRRHCDFVEEHQEVRIVGVLAAQGVDLDVHGNTAPVGHGRDPLFADAAMLSADLVDRGPQVDCQTGAGHPEQVERGISGGGLQEAARLTQKVEDIHLLVDDHAGRGEAVEKHLAGLSHEIAGFERAAALWRLRAVLWIGA